MGTVRFGNDHLATITGYADYVQVNLMIFHVYYVEGLGHNQFLVGQFCDGDLEVAFRLNTCYVRNLEGEDLLIGSHNSNLYTISISKMAASSPVCLMSKATSTKSWLWHRRLSYLNFACEQGKCKKALFPPKLVPSTESKLELLHIDLCGLMRVASINGKRYILVIVDDYSQYTWAQVLKVRSDNGTEFKNEKLRMFYAKLGITNNTSTVRTPQQNEFLWAEAIATACFTQNRSLVHTRYNKTPYELIKGRKPNVQYFHVFGSLCYPTNDRDDLGKMKPKANIGIFIGYSESSRGFHIYNCRTKKIMETIHVKFDELTAMASECTNSEYYVTSTPEVSEDSAANTLDYKDTPLSSSIIFEDDEAPQIVTSLEEPIANEATTSISNENANEPVQEDVAAFDKNEFYNPFHSPMLEEAESSSTFQNLSNMHEFYQTHCSTDKWTKDHPIEQVIGDPLSLRLDVLELVERPVGRIIIAVKWLWKNKTGVEKTINTRTVDRLEACQNLLAYAVQEFPYLSDGYCTGCNDDCKSTSGSIKFLGDKIVSWSSKKKNCIAMSTVEAEYISLSACCAQVIWMRIQLLDYGFRYNKIPMYYDSKSGIALLSHPAKAKTRWVIG
ncbi:retrovirus-related pol polyprotein from transposon TNT 1-94 [Tanacetum coccineum]